MGITLETSSFRLADYFVDISAREVTHCNGAVFRVEAANGLSLLFDPGEQPDRLLEMFKEAKLALLWARSRENLEGNVGPLGWH